MCYSTYCITLTELGFAFSSYIYRITSQSSMWKKDYILLWKTWLDFKSLNHCPYVGFLNDSNNGVKRKASSSWLSRERARTRTRKRNICSEQWLPDAVCWKSVLLCVTSNLLNKTVNIEKNNVVMMKDNKCFVLSEKINKPSTHLVTCNRLLQIHFPAAIFPN